MQEPVFAHSMGRGGSDMTRAVSKVLARILWVFEELKGVVDFMKRACPDCEKYSF
jgi:hypothetical protein